MASALQQAMLCSRGQQRAAAHLSALVPPLLGAQQQQQERVLSHRFASTSSSSPSPCSSDGASAADNVSHRCRQEARTTPITHALGPQGSTPAAAHSRSGTTTIWAQTSQQAQPSQCSVAGRHHLPPTHGGGALSSSSSLTPRLGGSAPLGWHLQHRSTPSRLLTPCSSPQAAGRHLGRPAWAAAAATPGQQRGMAVIKDIRPATLDDVVRRHRNQGNVRGFQVIEIYPNGAQLDLTTPMSAADLGIPFRDAMLFSSENSITDQKPTILVRKGAILFKSEAIRAVVNENKAYIIKVKSHRSYVNLLQPLMETVQQDDAIPFELNVLEGLLYISCRWFDSRMKHLKSIMEGLMRDVNDGTEPFAAVYNEALIQQLAPLDKAITSLRNGARDTCEAVRHLLENEDMLSEICLTFQKEKARQAAEMEGQMSEMGCVPDMGAAAAAAQRAAAATALAQACGSSAVHYFDADYLSDKEQARRMLESYDRELDAIAGKLEEMRENLDTVRDSWSMKLDSARNHIILLNLKMTLASLCLMLATLFPSWGGMNINHGMPDEPWVFWTVVVFGSLIGVLAYPLASHMYRMNWKLRSQRDLLRFHSLRAFLVEHLDDLDDVMHAMRRINHRMNRAEFEVYMKDQLPASTWKRPSLDFLFSQYDLNKDGFLEGMEVAKKAAEEKMVEEMHMPGYLTRTPHLDELYEASQQEQSRTWLEWLLSKPAAASHVAHTSPMASQHKHRTWLAELWFGPPRAVQGLEERSGGRLVRH